MKKFIKASFILLASLLPLSASAAPAADQAKQKAPEEVMVNMTEINVVSEAAVEKIEAVETDSPTKLSAAERNKRIKDADSTGLGITLMSMAIVICALIVLSLLFLAFGKISQSMHTKKKLKEYGLAHDEENHEAYSGEACAAIAAALHQYFNDRHDVEDTVLTMRKLKRAYSPWSSKLYGLRHLPERNTWHR